MAQDRITTVGEAPEDAIIEILSGYGSSVRATGGYYKVVGRPMVAANGMFRCAWKRHRQGKVVLYADSPCRIITLIEADDPSDWRF
jgi:hypothetical protein